MCLQSISYESCSILEILQTKIYFGNIVYFQMHKTAAVSVASPVTSPQSGLSTFMFFLYYLFTDNRSLMICIVS